MAHACTCIIKWYHVILKIAGFHSGSFVMWMLFLWCLDHKLL
jgi:hypothetical protein